MLCSFWLTSYPSVIHMPRLAVLLSLLFGGTTALAYAF
jgi:hypothetical protein